MIPRPCAIHKARAMPIKMTEPDIRITVMSDGYGGLGIETGESLGRARVVSTTRLAPVFHAYRAYYQRLSCVFRLSS